MSFLETIIKKRDGRELTEGEIFALVRDITTGEIPDYQASAWLMATFLRGMTAAETLALTLAMRDSGETVDLSDLASLSGNATPPLDKHSTGGVGDKTTLVVVPMLGAAGVPLLKMSGRGLGHTGGTVDKLAAIPGFRLDLTIAQAKAQTAKIGAALIAQSEQLVPADKILYALRDATGTVESVPLIASSIMSKKLAAGSARILLDVKVGRGAFMETQEAAETLARTMIEIGNGAGVPTTAVLTSMDEPLGWMIGNALEVREALQVLTNQPDSEPRFRELCLTLAAHGLMATGKARSEAEAREISLSLLRSGEAAQKFAEISEAQGGADTVEKIVNSFPVAEVKFEVRATESGFIHEIDARALGSLAMRMGAGRERKTDSIDPTVGIELHAKSGVKIEKGQLLATLHLSRSDDDLHTEELALDSLRAFTVGSEKTLSPPLILKTLE